MLAPLDKFTLLKRFAHIIFIITMIVSQGAEAFSSAEMPCLQDHMMQLDGSYSDFPESAMKMDGGNDNCCPKDCCCPMGVLTIAVLVDDAFKAFPDFTSAQVFSFEPELKTVFLNPLQRPPKHLSV